MLGTIYVLATALYAVGINQLAALCVNPYSVFDISSSGTSSPTAVQLATWTNHTTGFTLRYYVSISGAYLYSGYTNTTNIYI